jgi:hypothetical protein
MRIATLAFVGGLGLAALPLSAGAGPTAPQPAAGQASGIIQVWGGCGPGWHPVPGHWTTWRGWVPPHCRPNHPWHYW